MKVHYALIDTLDFWIKNNTNSPADTKSRVQFFKKMKSYLIERLKRSVSDKKYNDMLYCLNMQLKNNPC